MHNLLYTGPPLLLIIKQTLQAGGNFVTKMEYKLPPCLQPCYLYNLAINITVSVAYFMQLCDWNVYNKNEK